MIVNSCISAAVNAFQGIGRRQFVFVNSAFDKCINFVFYALGNVHTPRAKGRVVCPYLFGLAHNAMRGEFAFLQNASPYMPSIVTGLRSMITLANCGRGIRLPVLHIAIALFDTPKSSAALRSSFICFRYSVSFMTGNSTRIVDKCNTFCVIIFQGRFLGVFFKLLGWESRPWAA